MAKTKFSRGDIVQVDWLDAHSKCGWWDKGDTKWDGRGFPVTFVCTVVEDTQKGITLTLGFAEDGNAGGAFFVPKGMIMSKKLLFRAKRIKPCWSKPYGKKSKP
jgi:hypothetical protein